MRARWWLWLVPALSLAQSPALVATRIYVEDPCGRARATFWVDGTPYNGPVTLFWPEGSKHILSIPASQEIAPGIRCDIGNWVGVHLDREETKLDGLSIAVTAHRDLTAFKAVGQLSYLLTIQIVSQGTLPAYFDCTPGPRYGKIYVNGTCYAANDGIWIPADSEVMLQAYPPEGFVFNGWQPDLASSQAFESKFRMNRPIVLYALFAPAVRVRLETDPPELELLADRTRVRAPITLDWGEGSRHTLAPVSPQMDLLGRWWVFDSWSNGQPAQQLYVPGKANVPERVTARFVRGAQVSLLTEPPGMNLEVDGRDNWPSLNFIWGVGHTHRVAAPAEQSFRGRRWTFAGWSNGGPALQQITVPAEAADQGLRLVARYQMLARLRIESTHPVIVQINGSACRTPCLIEPPQGSVIALRAPERVELDEWRRLEFQGWADQAAAERLWTAGPAEELLWLNYQASYRVLALVAPAEGAAIRFEPASPDGFYAAGSPLRLLVEPRPGFRFKLWDGDVPGASPELAFTVSEPRIVRAVLERVPWVPPSGVRNAAGVT
ncbi:MAG: InlB B-repeat-containing protein, partial [Chloroflexaceae bacterium]